jgi:pilus assembly protein CpaB
VRRSNIAILIIAIVMGGIAAALARSWWAASTLPEGAFATKHDLLKDGRRVLLTPLERNEPILSSKITAPGQRGSLSSLPGKGKRAVTVRVDGVRGVAGFILPNDRVDVVLIRSEGENYSDILLQDVKVLAIDQLANRRQETPTVAKAVTLEVSTHDAQKVLLATNTGKLSLILRQAGQGNPEPTRRPPPPQAALIAPKDMQRKEEVRALRGLCEIVKISQLTADVWGSSWLVGCEAAGSYAIRVSPDGHMQPTLWWLL